MAFHGHDYLPNSMRPSQRIGAGKRCFRAEQSNELRSVVAATTTNSSRRPLELGRPAGGDRKREDAMLAGDVYALRDQAAATSR
jgi:hypothetical protein